MKTWRAHTTRTKATASARRLQRNAATGYVFAVEHDPACAPFAFRVTHPRFLAFVPGAPTFLSVLGDLLCSGTNFFAGVWLEAPGPSEVELVVLDWFRGFLGLPPTTAGQDVRAGAVTVRGQRLYELVSLPHDEQHALSVQVPPGVSAYDFTFG